MRLVGRAIHSASAMLSHSEHWLVMCSDLDLKHWHILNNVFQFCNSNSLLLCKRRPSIIDCVVIDGASRTPKVPADAMPLRFELACPLDFKCISLSQEDYSIPINDLCQACPDYQTNWGCLSSYINALWTAVNAEILSGSVEQTHHVHIQTMMPRESMTECTFHSEGLAWSTTSRNARRARAWARRRIERRVRAVV